MMPSVPSEPEIILTMSGPVAQAGTSRVSMIPRGVTMRTDSTMSSIFP